MHLTVMTSREVARMLVSATSEWGLGKEAWAASLALRIRTGLNVNHFIVEDTLRELM